MTSDPVFVVVIPGVPVGQGSMQLSRNPVNGREFVKYPARTVKHRNLAVQVIRDAWQPRGPLRGPLAVECEFVMPRPLSHYGTGRNKDSLKLFVPSWHTSYPDVDKALRLVNDALQIAGVLLDDSQVALIRGEKVYGEVGSTEVRVHELPTPGGRK